MFLYFCLIQKKYILLSVLVLLGCLAGTDYAYSGRHCGQQGDFRSYIIPDFWPPRGFKIQGILPQQKIKTVPIYKSCIGHDKCYDRPGVTRKYCDEKFHSDMKKQCEKAYPGILNSMEKKACESAAYGYYRAVCEKGGEAFKQAQNRARKKSNRLSAKKSDSQQEKEGLTSKIKFTDCSQKSALKWSKFNLPMRISGLAFLDNRLFILSCPKNEIWWADISNFKWKRFCRVSAGTKLTAGSGHVFIWNPKTKLLKKTKPFKASWKMQGKLEKVSHLAATHDCVFVWDSTSKEIKKSLITQNKWVSIGKTDSLACLYATGGKFYIRQSAEGEIKLSGIDKWEPRAFFKAPKGKLLAVSQEQLFIWDPETKTMWVSVVKSNAE